MPHFIMDNCIGCAACAIMCPTECIAGDKKELHIIDSELCIDCGICGNVCPVEAIIDNRGDVVAKKKITKDRTKARVMVELCSGCVFCVDACPYGALEMVNAPEHAGEGGGAAGACHVGSPNTPGYGCSGRPTATGWGPARIGAGWVELRKRLGYEQFVAAGGDWGGGSVEVMAGGRDAPASPEPAPAGGLRPPTHLPGGVSPPNDKGDPTRGPPPPPPPGDEPPPAKPVGLPLSHQGIRGE